MLPFALHPRSHSFDKDAKHLFLAFGVFLLLQLMPVFSHPLEKIFGWDEVSFLPAIIEK